jgi:hypothetical protein
LSVPGSAIGGRGETGVSPAASTSLSGQILGPGFGQVGQQLTGFGVENHGPQGDFYNLIGPMFSVPVLAFPGPSVSGPEMLVHVKSKERVFLR